MPRQKEAGARTVSSRWGATLAAIRMWVHSERARSQPSGHSAPVKPADRPQTGDVGSDGRGGKDPWVSPFVNGRRKSDPHPAHKADYGTRGRAHHPTCVSFSWEGSSGLEPRHLAHRVMNRVDGGARLGRGAHVEDSPDVVEEGGEHPSKLLGDGQEIARDLMKLAVDVRERLGER